ncbi:hypothetical protein SAMN04487894_10983 [Niabella drilacis]|uniref:Uncharacterized protein n=2 Tax=Niabella drilacis (strain DSM 25811 / CCM 8410 / CCUG 62505 / LMG 26954 / E90) TaxID=1285928 RepID=A0A1G6UTD7_NIADE|nr:hypothetical protein SAMN04487894_10983 [Niabella drilacis]
MPGESLADDERTDLLVEQYDELLSGIEKPITPEEGEVLIRLFPQTAFYDLQWDLLQLVESLYGKINNEEYFLLIQQCPSTEWRAALSSRYENAQKKH